MWARKSAQTEERHANAKLAFSERLRRHRDAGKEGAWAVPPVREENMPQLKQAPSPLKMRLMSKLSKQKHSFI